jgi:hypothetical protein
MSVFRSDVLANCKSFHITIDKDVYIQLRMLLFKHDCTLPQIFNFFATQLTQENSKAQKILEDFLVHKIQRQIGGRKLNKKYKLPKQISEQDQTLLYNLIERYDSSHEDDEENSRTNDDSIPIEAITEAFDEDPKTSI